MRGRASRASPVDVTDQSAPIHGDVVNAAYDNPRDEVTILVPPAARTVLDVGCSTGAMGSALRARGHVVTGIEHDPVLADRARGRLDEVIVGDVEMLARAGADIPGQPFDCVVMADVLEHLRDPWAVVHWVAPRVADGGSMVISVPNIRHLETFWALAVRRRWPYKRVGIFDRTHLRFFARANLPDLLGDTGFRIAELRRTHTIRLDPTWRWNRLAPYLGDFGTLQFIFRAERG